MGEGKTCQAHVLEVGTRRGKFKQRSDQGAPFRQNTRRAQKTHEERVRRKDAGVRKRAEAVQGRPTSIPERKKREREKGERPGKRPRTKRSSPFARMKRERNKNAAGGGGAKEGSRQGGERKEALRVGGKEMANKGILGRLLSC